MWKTVAKWAFDGLPVIIMVIALVMAYKVGSNSGADGVQADWDAAKLRHTQELAELESLNDEREAAHRRQSARYSEELALAERNHLLAMRDLERDFAERMRDSERRAAAYERMSGSGATERANLAGFAAQLDRSLEQGRLLVGELRSAVVQRDQQLQLLGEQLHADRRLINGTE